METVTFERKMSIDKYLEQESEEKILERKRILDASSAVQPKYNRAQVQQLINDCEVSANQAAKTRDDLGNVLAQLKENEELLLLKAVEAFEEVFGAPQEGQIKFKIKNSSKIQVQSGTELAGVKLIPDQK